MHQTNPILARGAIITACMTVLLALLCIRQQAIISRLTDERDALRAQLHTPAPSGKE